jgi:hypothetical protein
MLNKYRTNCDSEYFKPVSDMAHQLRNAAVRSIPFSRPNERIIPGGLGVMDYAHTDQKPGQKPGIASDHDRHFFELRAQPETGRTSEPGIPI